MADLKYILEIDTSRGVASLNKLKSEIKSTNDSLLSFRNVLAGLAAAVSVRSLVNLSDTITNLRNRLIGVSPTLQDVDNQFKAVAAIAIASRAPLEAVGDLYFRIARAGGELGLSQRQAADITDTLAKSLSMTGVSAQEAAGPLLQIGQALQSGRFQGDELRSVLEGMPVVSQALADELGVTVGELRKLGSEGKITGDVFVRAMERARDSVNEAFIRTTPTISQAFENLRTAAALAFNEFEKNTGVGRSTAAAIELLGFQLFKLTKNIDDIIGPLTTFVKVIGALAAFTFAGRILKAFEAALFGIIRAVTGLSAYFRNTIDAVKDFGKIIQVGGDKLLGFGEAVIYVLSPLGKLLTGIGALAAGIYAFLGIEDFINWFKSLGNENSEAQKDLQAYRAELQKFSQNLSDVEGENKAAAAQQAELQRLIDKTTESLKRAAQGYQETANAQQKNLRQQIDDIGASEEQIRVKNSLRQAESAYLSEAKRLQDELFRVKQSDKAEDKAQIPVILGLLADLDRRYKDNLETNKALTEELNHRLAVEKQLAEFDKMDDGIEKIKKSIAATNEQIALETAKIRMSEAEKSAVDARYSLEQARLREIEPLQQRILELKRSNSEADKTIIPILEEGIARINGLYAEQAIKQAELLALKERELQIQKLIEFTDKTRIDTADKLREIQRDTAKLTMTDIERKYYDIANAAEDSARRAIEAEEKRRGQKLPIEEQRKYYDEARKQAEQLIQAQAKHQQQATSWSTGWTKAYKDYIEDSKNAAKTAETVFKTATKGMEDAIVGFAKTGKFEWKGFVSSMLEELLRSQIRQLMGQIFSFNSNPGGTGLFSGGSLLGFANGGIIPTNGPVLVGERGPELLSGAAGRVVTPNNQLGSTNVTYNISAVDALSFRQLVARDPGFIHAVATKGSAAIPAGR